jgi:uncharacterized protein (TIGR00369 family)
MGTLHGGILCDIGDAAMGTAYSSNLEEGESFTTPELKINFLKPIWIARLSAVGRVVNRGPRVRAATQGRPYNQIDSFTVLESYDLGITW